MRLPFEISTNKIDEGSRVKFLYTSSELHQNIEISLDGENTSIEAMMDAFHRFLSALGISIPPDVTVGFVELENEEDEDGEGEDSENN